jgi:hypothetical protein
MTNAILGRVDALLRAMIDVEAPNAGKTPSNDQASGGAFQIDKHAILFYTRSMSGPHSYHWSPPLELQFCAVLAETGSVRAASRAVGMSPKLAYARRKRNAAFAARWRAAVEEAREEQFDIMLGAALEGTVSQLVRNARTRRAGWRAVDPRLGPGRGMGLLGRLDRALGRFRPNDESSVTFGGKP